MENILKGVKGVVFDLDGTLIDSMHVWDKVGVDFLLERNLTPPENFKVAIAAMTFTQSAEYLVKLFNLPMTTAEVMECWVDMAYNEYKNNIPLKEGVLEYLRKLKKSDIKIALATSCIDNLCSAALRRNGIIDFFDVIVSSTTVPHSKSQPDIYLETAKKMGILPQDIIVFEDAPYAVEGAKKAGMKVVGVYDRCFANEEGQMQKICDYYIRSFIELI